MDVTLDPGTGTQESIERALRELNAELEQRVLDRTRELEASRERLAEAQQIANVGSWEYDVESGLLLRSAEMCRMLGLPLDMVDTFADMLWDRVHAEDRVRLASHIRRAVRTGEPSSHEYRVLGEDGIERVLHMRTRAVVDVPGSPARLMGTVQDVTARRATDRELERRAELLQQSQKMEAVGMLAGGVAHDFNNMLMVIRGQAEHLQRQLPARDAARRRADAILRTVDRAAALTMQLLAFGCRQPHDPGALDVNAVLDDVEEMLSRLAGVSVRLVRVAEPGSCRIWADRGQLEQIVVNLVVNARDAMPNGGAITIETTSVTIDESLARRLSATPDDYLRLTVRDEGVGMDADVLAHLFEPFFTTKPLGKGTGLGLSAVYGIVKQSGGYIDVESEPGRGTSVTIYFPQFDRTHEAHSPIAANAVHPDDVRVTETILLAEDEDGVRELVTDFLESLNYRVLSASNGLGALEKGEDYGGSIDLLLTDVVMPTMGGPELADRLVLARPAIRVLFMSGYTPTFASPGGTFRPEAPLLRKPFSLDALASAVRDCLVAPRT